jgi:hypothetical protein
MASSAFSDGFGASFPPALSLILEAAEPVLILKHQHSSSQKNGSNK